MVSYIAGDVNGDGEVNISDATALLSIYAQMGAGVISEPGEYEQLAGDVITDGVLDIADATEILRIYANRGAGLD